MKSKRNLLFRSLFFLAVIFLCIGSAKRVDAAAAAKIGSRRYKTVAKALYAAKNGDTVKLLRNASYIIDVLDKDPIKKKKITINLNHKTLDIMGRMRITKKSNVKIKNGKIITSSPGHFRVEGKSKVTMTNCTLETNSGSGFMVSGKKSSLKLNKCTGLLDGAGITAEKKASLTVNKGSYRIRNYS
ncbi:MAG: hypothetical protein IJ121_11825 [Eubacterium sp.]|nr:hypothetical protein [Eubacterium sp.]